MRFHAVALWVAVSWVAGVHAHYDLLVQERNEFSLHARAVTTPPPDCSLNCLSTLVPQYCGSPTNTACVCSSSELTAALGTCVFAACNITDSLQLQRYAAESCNVPHDKSRYREQIQVITTLAVLSTLFVALRIYTRVQIDIGFGLDDWLILSALFTYLLVVMTGAVEADQRFGEHTFWLTISEVQTSLKFFYIGEMLYLLTITFTKLSLLFFLRRIFPTRYFRYMTFGAVVFIVLSNFSVAMSLCLQCIPFHGTWTNWMYKTPPVKCINFFAVAFVAAGLSIFHDVLILTMPLTTLWGLKLHWQKKASLFIMFSLGSFVVVCSILRLPSLLKFGTSTDPSYDQAPISVWTHLEAAVGIICACLPACRSLIGFLFPNLKATLVSSEKSRHTGAYAVNPAHHRFSSKGPHSRSFIELADRTESQETLEEEARVGSRPLTQDKLIHAGRDGFGSRAVVEIGVARGVNDEMEKSGNGIVMTTTVDQTEKRM